MTPQYRTRQDFFDDLNHFLSRMEACRSRETAAKPAEQAKALLEAYIEQRQHDILGN